MTDPLPFEWLNEPADCERSSSSLSFSVSGGTDFWRKTHDGGVRANGHFGFVTVTGDFTLSANVSGEFGSQYDQAGLMARLDDETWLKCGVEYVDAAPYASAVVTRAWSDWSVVPIERSTLRWRLTRHGETFTVDYSDADDSSPAREGRMIRQAFLTDRPELAIGFMACAPKGNGFAVRFSAIELTGSATQSRAE